jgi:hypothetical protein
MLRFLEVAYKKLFQYNFVKGSSRNTIYLKRHLGVAEIHHILMVMVNDRPLSLK